MTTVPPGNQLCTGDTLTSDLVTWQFQAPNEIWIAQAIYGLISLYGTSEAWYPCGAVSVDDTVQAFISMWESLTVVKQAGIIISFGGIAVPAGTLPCDGSSYLRTDYPQLFAAIGVVWGSADSTHFNVPFLPGRTLIGAGTGSGLSPRTLADIGGEETHQLTVGEMPSHTHAQAQSFLSSTVVPPPLDGLSPNPLSNRTGSTGGDGDHNNMQPFAVVNYAITFQ